MPDLTRVRHQKTQATEIKIDKLNYQNLNFLVIQKHNQQSKKGNKQTKKKPSPYNRRKYFK